MRTYNLQRKHRFYVKIENLLEENKYEDFLGEFFDETQRAAHPLGAAKEVRGINGHGGWDVHVWITRETQETGE